MRSLLGVTLLPLLISASPISVGSIHNGHAPILSATNAKVIPNSYMIVFKDHVNKDSATAHHSWVLDLHRTDGRDRTELRKRNLNFEGSWGEVFNGLKHTFHIPTGLMGYSGHFADEVIDQIRAHPDVAYIERDSEVHTMGDSDDDDDSGVVEKGAPWGLARISHRESLSFGNFNKYAYAEDGGEGVDVYIIDTGTNIDHVDFEGRAEWGATIPDGDEDADGNGHGTHCSGTVAGKKYGVAKKANIKAVKVLRSNGSGSMSDVVKGVEFAADSHLEKVEAAKKGKAKKFKGSAANMSLGGQKSPTLDKAVDAAVEIGIHFAVAAGNDNADSCGYSPAAAEKAVTVGASDLSDTRAYFSNFGKCNDIFAPGVEILSTWIGSEYAVNTISGTSMASPHIAGLLAYLLSLQPATDSEYAVAEISPKKLKAHLLSIATRDALTDVPSDTVNILAWNGGGSSNFTDIINKGSYTVGKASEPEVVISIPTSEEAARDVVNFEDGEWIPSFDELQEDLGFVISVPTAKEIENGFELFEEVVQNDVATAKEHFGEMRSDVSDRMRNIATKIEDIVAEEMRDLFEDLE